MTQNILKLQPPTEGVYHGVFLICPEEVENFEWMAGHKVAWVYYQNDWKNGITFPETQIKALHLLGKTPYIRMEPGDQHTLEKIIAGNFDDSLDRWIEDAKKADIPLLIVFGAEVNGNWMQWNGERNGKDTETQETTKSGKPRYLGQKRFRDAYIHIIDRFRQKDFNKVTWFFHVTYESKPDTTNEAKDWNSIAGYYPGDDYIDWIGISCYGAQSPATDGDSFKKITQDIYGQIENIPEISNTKPIAIVEMGVSESDNFSKAAWINQALIAMRVNQFKRIKGICWWHENWWDTEQENEPVLAAIRIDSSQTALNAYRNGINYPYFVDRAIFSDIQPKVTTT